MRRSSKLGAEFIGTYVLVFGGTGAAVLAAKFLDPVGANTGLGIGFVGVSLAFGLTVLTMAYAVGHISGGHFNPAIAIGLAAAKRFEWREACPTSSSSSSRPSRRPPRWSSPSAKGHDETASPPAVCRQRLQEYSGSVRPGGLSHHRGGADRGVPGSHHGTTDKRASRGFAALASGLALTLIHLISIPVTNTSVNPARSTGPAIMLAFAGKSWALGQLWLFWVAPVIGGVIGALIYRAVAGDDTVSDAAVMEVT
jgi:aquaporin Z